MFLFEHVRSNQQSHSLICKRMTKSYNVRICLKTFFVVTFRNNYHSSLIMVRLYQFAVGRQEMTSHERRIDLPPAERCFY